MKDCKICSGLGCLECESGDKCEFKIVDSKKLGWISSNKYEFKINNSLNIPIEVTVKLVPIIEIILKEYHSACQKHPTFPDSKFEQFAILSEEIHEYNKEIQNDAHEGIIGNNTITELAQIGAVVLRMLEEYK